MAPSALTASTSTAPRRALRLSAGALCLGLAGCIVVPRMAQVYDPQCRTYVKQVVLETEVIGVIGHCHHDRCALMLASMGIITAASAVVAGSVAIVGNIAYWAERQGQCPAERSPPPATLQPRVQQPTL